jgi:hypothetical protein
MMVFYKIYRANYEPCHPLRDMVLIVYTLWKGQPNMSNHFLKFNSCTMMSDE